MTAIALLVLGLVFPCLQKIRDGERWVWSAARLKQVGVACLSYHDAYGGIPKDALRDHQGNDLLSWRVAVLPYLEQDFLYRQFRLDLPWDSPHNARFLDLTPKCYEPYATHDEPGFTRYLAILGPGTAFEKPGLTWADFPDGRENTFLVVDAKIPVPWTRPYGHEIEHL
jgi:hypothetical protein